MKPYHEILKYIDNEIEDYTELRDENDDSVKINCTYMVCEEVILTLEHLKQWLEEEPKK